MPVSTTFDALRAGIVTAIRGIAPTNTPGASSLWNRVDAREDVPSNDARNFFVELDVPTEAGEVFGGCLEHEAELRIWTSYGGLKPATAQVLAASDHHDLWTTLNRAAIDGLALVEKDGFEPESDDGRLWGAHIFTARFFLPLGL